MYKTGFEREQLVPTAKVVSSIQFNKAKDPFVWVSNSSVFEGVRSSARWQRHSSARRRSPAALRSTSAGRVCLPAAIIPKRPVRVFIFCLLSFATSPFWGAVMSSSDVQHMHRWRRESGQQAAPRAERQRAHYEGASARAERPVVRRHWIRALSRERSQRAQLPIEQELSAGLPAPAANAAWRAVHTARWTPHPHESPWQWAHVHTAPVLHPARIPHWHAACYRSRRTLRAHHSARNSVDSARIARLRWQSVSATRRAQRIDR